MKLFKGIPARLGLKKPLLAIGVFDGVHKGHLAVLRRLRGLKGTPGVLTFDSLPEHVIAPGYAPPALCSTRQKLELLEKAGARFAMLVRFDRRFAALSASGFAGKLERLGIKELVVGDDFVFGAHASGNAEFLRNRGFKVHEVKALQSGGRPVSSTRIRAAVSGGHMAEAKRLLGRPFLLSGRVQKGQRLGRKLGFPTANLKLEHEALPKAGVWGGKVKLGSKEWPVLANLGVRPTLGGKRFVAELHLLGFKGDLYGKRLEAELQLYLRPEKRFESLEALKRQIRLDESRFRRSRAFRSAWRSSGARLGSRR
jgi:riboflavin kinase/FMN adenylyltransferase